MARPKKQIVDYFPHDTDASDSRLLTVLQNKYGNDGYAFWFKLKELLGRTSGHYYNFQDGDDWEFLLAKTHISDPETAKRILDTLAILKAIDPELHRQGIIWSQELVDSVEDVYKKRKETKPERPNSVAEIPIPETKTMVPDSSNPQSKVKETKSEESKVKEREKGENITHSAQDSEKETKIQKVIDAYRENFLPRIEGQDTEELSEEMQNEIRGACLKFSPEWMLDAFREAVSINKRSWPYIYGILHTWRREGKPKRAPCLSS